MLGFVRNIKIVCSEDLVWFIEGGCSSQKFHSTFRKFYGHHKNLVHKFDTSVSHMLKGLFNNCDIWLVSSYFSESWRVPHLGQDMLFRNTWFHSLWWVHDLFQPFIIHVYIYYIICQPSDYVYGLMTPGIVWPLCKFIHVNIYGSIFWSGICIIIWPSGPEICIYDIWSVLFEPCRSHKS